MASSRLPEIPAYSYKAPDSYVDTNVKGTLYMVQAARQHGVRKFIQTSTSEVYGSARYVPIDENHPVTPQSPYSASKIASDAMAMSFYYAFNTPVTIARPFNTYGPRQSARAVIPTIISQVASGQTEIQLGDLTTTRDFTFALDTAQGFIAIAEMEGGEGETYQIGTNNEIPVGGLVELIGRLMDRPVRAVLDPQRIRPEKSEVLRLNCNNAKLKTATGFAPATSIEEGLTRTIEWFQNPVNLKKYKSHLYNV